MYYLEDEDHARQLVELGYRGSGDTLTRDEFDEQKKILRERNVHKANVARALSSAGKDLSESPFLAELAAREESILSGRLTSILFLRCRNSKKQEVRGVVGSASAAQEG